MAETTSPCKDGSDTVSARLTTLLVNAIMTGHSTVGSFRFDCLSIGAELEANKHDRVGNVFGDENKIRPP